MNNVFFHKIAIDIFQRSLYIKNSCNKLLLHVLNGGCRCAKNDITSACLLSLP